MKQTMINASEYTLKTIQHQAAQGEVGALQEFISQAQENAQVAPEVLAHLAAVSCRLQLGGVFAEGLTKLGELQPTITLEAENEQVLSGEQAAQKLSDFRQGISGYLEGLGSEVNQASQAGTDLSPLQRALGQEERRAQALALLGKTEEQPDRDWMIERARMTEAGVQEYLWEIVNTGRDTVAFLGASESEQRADIVAGWRRVIGESFAGAEDNLQRAVDWLLG